MKQRVVEKVVDLKKNRKGEKWFKVKYVGDPKTEWLLEGQGAIPNDMIDECLKRRTWAGTKRKRKLNK